VRFDEVQARTREFAQSVEELGATVLRNQLRRAQVLAFFSRLPACLVGLEARATAHS